MALKSSHINPALKSLHWLKIKQHIDYKILSFTYKVLTTTQPSYLYNLISVQPHRSTRSSDIITLSRPPSSSSLKVNNRSFRHASPCLGESASQGTSPAYRSQRLVTLIWSHTCQFVFSCISTVTIYYSFSLPLQAQTHLFHKSFPPLFFYLSTHWTDSMNSSCFSFFCGISVETLALCARLSWLPVSF